ncbi:hypothetical protein WG908_06430 [Sphingobium sp. AN641]|uniref:hypothetical protein n=1 Tax=Sphingobium sp. AN641 TaxID=3133443 RepID=UPI0030BCE93A
MAIALGGTGTLLSSSAVNAQTPAVEMQAAKVTAPRFEVDPAWPKPLPNHWILGQAVGVSVDADEHIWIVHRGSPTLGAPEKFLETKDAECCAAAPPVLEFDQAGNLLRHWGGPGEGFEWPDGMHSIYVDHKGNVWLGGSGAADAHILKFTKDGKFLMQVGKKGARRSSGALPDSSEGAAPGFAADSSDQISFGSVAKIMVDPKTNEAYIADGYLNKRLVVIDADTGKFKRYWGAYGNKPDDKPMPNYDPAEPIPQQFRKPVHCVGMSVDRLIYVCDRSNDRLQVFTPEGKFVKEAFFDRNTKGAGSVWDIAFSRDAQQRYIYMADGSNNKIRVIDRKTLAVVTQFGDGGRQPGQFYGVHSIATDAKGNIYTTETWEGKRLQRFNYKGIGAVPVRQGIVWPAVR